MERTSDPPGAVCLGGLSSDPCFLPHITQGHPWEHPQKSQDFEDCDAMRT